MLRLFVAICGLLFLYNPCQGKKVELSVDRSQYDMSFQSLSKTWDEAMPIGNGTIGSLVWQSGDHLRMSIDRVDFWDLRPVDELSGDKFSFAWLYNQVMKNDYKPVQQQFDRPYSLYPGPSKIPGAGIELPLSGMGAIERVHLYQKEAVCEVLWKSGRRLQCFIHAEQPVGWFIIDGADADYIPQLVPPTYEKEGVNANVQDHSKHSLQKLGYKQGAVEKCGDNKLVYKQCGWGTFSYTVAIKWKVQNGQLIGVWSATSSLVKEDASEWVDDAWKKGITHYYQTHLDWWNSFYAHSSITIPDKVIERQYYNEVYKMGCIARKNSYPISLQAVWTADNGKLPPWKGDYHHDLNTQLSYWPFYTGNYLEEGYGYLNTLWNQRETHKAYTKDFFGTEGLNVPGVCTLQGQPMGGWCQYAMSPTASAWLGQHFYLHWKYSQDRKFLKERAYPYIKDVATYLEQFTVLKDGKRVLPLSSSPEFYDNSINAWFKTMTNYDCALIHFIFDAAAELASELGLKTESTHWHKLQKELPDYELAANGGLSIAKGHPYVKSHRHFSHLMAIHPLGLIDKSHGDAEAAIIDSTLATLEKCGPNLWTGYSYSWFANLKARAFDGEGASRALRIFAECFCLRNGFHANGDQSKTGKSKFTYRPFTLEGNMAFASGVQEMLLQSHTGIIKVFPAIPTEWKDVSFKQLRAMGAFLISAEMRQSEVVSVEIVSEKGGILKIKNPFKKKYKLVSKKQSRITEADGILKIATKPGERVTLVSL